MIWLAAFLPLIGGAGALVARRGGPRLLAVWAILVCFAAAAVALLVPAEATMQAWVPGLPLHAQLTALSRPVAVLVPLVTAVVVLYALAHEAPGGRVRMIALILVFSGAMEMVLIAGDLVTLLIGWEVMGACSWALIGHDWRARAPMRSANYAFAATRLGDLGLYLASIVLLTQTGSARIEALGDLPQGAMTLAAGGLVLAGIAKSGQVPFAPWLFRAMDGPTSVSALLHSSTMVAAGAYLLARVHAPLASLPGFGAALIAIGLLTALAGGVVALLQMHSKKVLAASSSAQVGLMIAAVGAGYPAVAMLHLLLHALFKAPLFFAAGIAHDAAGSFDLAAMRLRRAMPLVAWGSLPLALALAGAPPLGGALSKELVTAALTEAAPVLGILALFAGGLGAAYAARFWLLAFGFGAGKTASLRRLEQASLLALSAASVIAGLLWWPPAEHAAEAVLGTFPETGSLGFWAASAVLLIGAMVGRRLAGTPREGRGADWLGLPALIEGAVIAPANAAARWAARIDDGVIDALPRAAAAGMPLLARLAGFADDEVLDGMQRSGRRGAVNAVRAGTLGAARLGDRFGEWAADLLPYGGVLLSRMTASDLRRLQTGMSHHYFVLLAAGVGAGFAVLFFGG